MSDNLTSDDGPQCPYCGHVHMDCEDTAEVVSFWGMDAATDYECNVCGLEFQVREYVSRWWETKPVVQRKVRGE